MSEANKQVVMSYVEAFNRGDIEEMCRYFTPDAWLHGFLGWGNLRKAKLLWLELKHCFDINLQIESIIAEGDIVAVLYTEHGKSVQPFHGTPPTGRTYEITAMAWFEFKDGFIHQLWGVRDWLAQLKQMGLPLD